MGRHNQNNQKIIKNNQNNRRGNPDSCFGISLVYTKEGEYYGGLTEEKGLGSSMEPFPSFILFSLCVVPARKV